jgi:hypothetical protein
MSGDNLKALEAADLDAYVATDKGEKKNKNWVCSLLNPNWLTP